MSILPPLPACGLPAVRRIEIYAPRDGRAHGDLIASYYTCPAHETETVKTLDEAKLTPWRVPTPGPLTAKRCGDGVNFADRPMTFFTAPEVLERPIVAEASGALAAFGARNLPEAIRLLSGWTWSRGVELTPVETVAVLAGYATGATVDSVPVALPCPEWCTVDHSDPERLFVELSVSRIRDHRRELLRVDRFGEKALIVEVGVSDNLDDGRRGDPPTVWVFGADDGLSPEDAVTLAQVLPEAARIAQGGALPVTRDRVAGVTR